MRTLALSACAFCAIAAALHLASIAAVVRRMRRSEADKPREETLEGVSIVRPVCGLENFTEETLLSGFLLEYPDYEILFCVAQPSDPVIPLVRRFWQGFADSVGLGFAQGKTMLFRRAVLESAGGIRALGLESAEDAAFTKL